MKVAIIGSRNCQNFDITQIDRFLPAQCTEIVSGDAQGVDTIAEMYASEHEIPFTKFSPDYKKYGKKAPLLRNIQIIEAADLVLAFWDCNSPGTGYAISECVKRGIPFRIIPLQKL